VFGEIARLIPNPPPPAAPEAPGPFAFADRARVLGILEGAGWSNVAFEPFDLAMVVGGGRDPIADAVAYFKAIGPSARAASEMAEDERDRFFDRVRELAQHNRHEEVVALRAATWIVTARKP
jgi:hypothetical protein